MEYLSGHIEDNEEHGSLIKRNGFVRALNIYCAVAEVKGILSVEQIISKVKNLFDTEYNGLIDFWF